MFRNALLVYVTTASFGCGALFNSSTQTVNVRSEGSITVDGAPAGNGPTALKVSNHVNHTIVVGDKSCQLNASVGITWVVLDLLASGILPIIVDIVTEDWKGVDPSACSL